MTLPRYPRYKHSEIHWLGEIPAHWSVDPLKRHFDVCLGKMLQVAPSDDADQLKPYLRGANIQWRGVDVADVKLMWLSPRDVEQLALRMGDLLVSEGGDVGRSAIWKEELPECYLQNSVNRVRTKDKASTQFACYWMAAIKEKGYVDAICNRSTIAHFTAEKVAAVPTPFPRPSEQAAIAEFLDHETAKIDALIAEQEKLIALLAEKRQATISHAVTRGLDPNAPMKDSGVPWLGEVPAHWEVRPLKHLVALKSGGTPSKDRLDFWTDGDVPWASAKDLKVDVLLDTADHLTTLALQEEAADLVDAGAALVVVRGMILARTFPVSVAGVPMAINQDLKAVTTAGLLTRSYVPFLLRGTADESLRRLDEAGHGTKALRMEAWLTMRVPVPPGHEQEDIARHLSDRLNAIDALLKYSANANQLLQERRSALITAAVTGQIDVRGAVPQTDASAARHPGAIA